MSTFLSKSFAYVGLLPGKTNVGTSERPLELKIKYFVCFFIFCLNLCPQLIQLQSYKGKGGCTLKGF